MEKLFGGSDHDLVRNVRAELERAEAGGDEERLETLDGLYRSLENELEGDPDQAGSSRF